MANTGTSQPMRAHTDNTLMRTTSQPMRAHTDNTLTAHTTAPILKHTQHTLARVIESNTSETAAAAVVYVFGSGTLGQLGIGTLGVSRGKLLPTRLHIEPASTAAATTAATAGATATAAAVVQERGVVDVACGANHSVCVLDDGSVVGFGHSEYNQMGGRGQYRT
jgi:alpha-tubulin suppressor-like RCC1 family protein